MSAEAVNMLMATQAMGWEAFTDHGITNYPATMYRKQDGTKLFWRNWNPATDLNDAFTGLESVAKSKGGDYSIYSFDTGPNKTYSVEIDDDHRPQGGDNLAMAICRCALIASGVSASEIEKAVRA